MEVLELYAVIEVSGKQYMVQNGSTIYSDNIDANEGDNVSFKVLSFYDDTKLRVGAPYLDIFANAKLIKNGKAKKLTVFKYKPKKNYKRKIGHRQKYSKLEIVSIG